MATSGPVNSSDAQTDIQGKKKKSSQVKRKKKEKKKLEKYK